MGTTAKDEICADCGGAQVPDSDLPSCLCLLSPMAPTVGGQTVAEAQSLKCPSCGAHLESGLRQCSFCRVELGSVRCWRCFSLCFATGGHCARCGAQLGLEGDLGETELSCPGCRSECLHRVQIREHQISECPACTGVFIDHETLEKLTRRREQDAGALMVAVPSTSEAPCGGKGTLEPVRYRPCPICDKFMNRINFAGNSGVIVDVCRKHGTYFDPDELTRVLHFAATGGLTKSRERKMEMAISDLNRTRQSALSSQSHLTMSHSQPLGTSSVTALINAIFEIMG